MSMRWTSLKVLAGNKLFRVEKLPIRPCAHFIHDCRLEINLGYFLLYMRPPGFTISLYPVDSYPVLTTGGCLRH